MLSPFISSYVKIIKTDTSIRAVATQYIPQDTIIEICPVFTITNKDSITLTKSNPEFGKKLILSEIDLSKLGSFVLVMISTLISNANAGSCWQIVLRYFNLVPS